MRREWKMDLRWQILSQTCRDESKVRFEAYRED